MATMERIVRFRLDERLWPWPARSLAAATCQGDRVAPAARPCQGDCVAPAARPARACHRLRPRSTSARVSPHSCESRATTIAYYKPAINIFQEDKDKREKNSGLQIYCSCCKTNSMIPKYMYI